MLTITKIAVSQVMGIEEYEYNLGSGITLLKGKNASGKSSVLSAIRSALGGGHDATLKRKGAEKGEVVLVVEDTRNPDHTFATITKPVTDDKGKSRVKVRSQDAGSSGAAQSWIEEFVDLRSANPLDFLKLTDPRDRVKWLLESAPDKLSEEDLKSDTNLPADTVAELSAMHPFDALAKAEKLILEIRRGHNTTATERRNTIKTLTEIAPAMQAYVSPELIAEKDRQLRAIESEWRDKANDIRSTATRSESTIKSALADTDADLRKRRDAAIEEAHRMYAEQIEQARSEADQALAQCRNQADQYMAIARREYEPKVTTARQVYEAAVRAVEDSGRAKQAHADIERCKREAESAYASAAAYTEALVRIAKRRITLAEQNPIPEAKVVNGDIEYNGVTWDKVNEGHRIDLAVRLAEQRAGRLGLICIDGFERIDPDHQLAMATRLLDSKLPCIMGCVTAGPLRTLSINSVDDLKRSQKEDAQMILDARS